MNAHYQTLFPQAAKFTVKSRNGNFVTLLVHTRTARGWSRRTSVVFDDGLTVKRTVPVPGWSKPVPVL